MNAYTVWDGAAVIGVVRSASNADEALDLARDGKFMKRPGGRITEWDVKSLSVSPYAPHHFN